MLLAINQTKMFQKQGAKKHARDVIKRFMQKYEDLTQQHRELSQELFQCYDDRVPEPFYCSQNVEGRLKERDKWKRQISQSMGNVMATIQEYFEHVAPQRQEDGSAMYYSDTLASHLNDLHESFQRLDLA